MTARTLIYHTLTGLGWLFGLALVAACYLMPIPAPLPPKVQLPAPRTAPCLSST